LTLVVLIILAALWAVVLLPPLLRSRSVRTNDSIGDFNYRLDALGRTNGAVRPGVPTRVSSSQRAAKRRRDIVRALLMSFGVCGLIATSTNAALACLVFGVVTVAIAGFFALWAWARSVQAERALKVRAMPRQASPDLALRRAASS
jgi:hypothetical protein